MKVLYRQAAADDVAGQFQYYLVEENIPGTAVRFRDAVQYTLESLHEHPRIGPLYRSRNAQLHGLRSWPVAGFAIAGVGAVVQAEMKRKEFRGKVPMSVFIDLERRE